MARTDSPTPEAIKEALKTTSGFKGATGTLTIDKDHNANKPIVVVQVKGKKFTYKDELLSASN